MGRGEIKLNEPGQYFHFHIFSSEVSLLPSPAEKTLSESVLRLPSAVAGIIFRAFGKRAKSLSLVSAVWGQLIEEEEEEEEEQTSSRTTKTPAAPGVNPPPQLADGDKSGEKPQSGCS